MRTSLAGAFAAALLLLSGQAHGQTVDQKLISVRSPIEPGMVNVVTIQMEGVNSTGGRVLIGQPKKLTVNFQKDTKVLVDLVGPKVSPVPLVPIVVTGLRATVTTAGVPKVDVEPLRIHPKLDNQISLPLGTFVGCRYDMPPPTFDNLELAAAVTKWLASKEPFSIALISVPGNLRCSVGIKAVDIPAPLVAAGPVVTGPITTAPIGSGPSALVTSSIADGATFSGSSVWSATVTPDPTLVQFFVDGTLFAGIAGVPPYSTNLTALTDGPHQLEVKATYSDKSTKSAIVNVTAASGIPPLVVLNKPGDAAPPLPELNAPDGKWTFVARKVLRNGVDMTPLGYTDLARIYIANDGRLCTDGSVHGYLCWNGSAWGG